MTSRTRSLSSRPQVLGIHPLLSSKYFKATPQVCPSKLKSDQRNRMPRQRKPRDLGGRSWERKGQRCGDEGKGGIPWVLPGGRGGQGSAQLRASKTRHTHGCPELPSPSPCEDTEATGREPGRGLGTHLGADTLILDFSLQNCEAYMFVVYKVPSLCCYSSSNRLKADTQCLIHRLSVNVN